ncbi:MAG TPA: response regulator, partial [Aliiroseovarius sp.]|nr:response regulator [Aliiroseovarius sp.]
EEPNLPEWLHSAAVAMPDDMHRDILEKRLIALGLEVDASAACDDFAERAMQADIVFVDMSKACEKGLETAKALRADGLSAALVQITTPGAQVPGSEGVFDFQVSKPLMRPSLIKLLRELPKPKSATPPAPVFGSTRQAPQAPPPDPAPTIAPALEPPQEPAPPSETGPRAMRVLAAEDNKVNRLVFSKLVKAFDIELQFATNGREAVAAFTEFHPDLIFMDISMPEMDGKEATRSIRALEAERGLGHTRIVALTAHAMTGDGEEIMSHGLDAHLTKPLKKPAIMAEIKAACPKDARPSVPEPEAQAG